MGPAASPFGLEEWNYNVFTCTTLGLLMTRLGIDKVSVGWSYFSRQHSGDLAFSPSGLSLFL